MARGWERRSLSPHVVSKAYEEEEEKYEDYQKFARAGDERQHVRVYRSGNEKPRDQNPRGKKHSECASDDPEPEIFCTVLSPV